MSGVFRFEELDGGIGLLTIDAPEKKVNTLGRAVLEELSGIVDDLEKRDDLQGLLLQSGKPGQFIAGADLNELGALASATREQVLEAVGAGHELFARLSGLPFPTVALVDGACMGGGTELILSLDERIVSSGKTKIALPEVNVGLIPGWGGTQRLPRLIGIHAAIDMITSGAPQSPKLCVERGLAFDAVPAEQLLDEGRRVIGILRDDDLWQKNRQRRSQPLGLSEDQLSFAAAVSEGGVRAKTKGQYPAPLAALKAITRGINLPLEDGLKVEQEISLEVVGSTISANLIGVFFMNNQVARDPGFGGTSATPRDVARVGVLGTGQMGSGIATAHCRRGVPATMVDVDEQRIGWGMAAAKKVIESRMKIGRATPQDMANMLSLLSTSTSKTAFGECDVVVEAITENEDLKTAAYRELDGVLDERADPVQEFGARHDRRDVPVRHAAVAGAVLHLNDHRHVVALVRGGGLLDQHVDGDRGERLAGIRGGIPAEAGEDLPAALAFREEELDVFGEVAAFGQFPRQFPGHHGDGGERAAEFVGGGRGDAAHGGHALFAGQRLLCGRQCGRELPGLLGHPPGIGSVEDQGDDQGAPDASDVEIGQGELVLDPGQGEMGHRQHCRAD